MKKDQEIEKNYKKKLIGITIIVASILIILVILAWLNGFFSDPYPQFEGTWKGNIHLESGNFNKIKFGADKSVCLYFSSGFYESTCGSYHVSFGKVIISAPYCDESLSYRFEDDNLYLNDNLFLKD